MERMPGFILCDDSARGLLKPFTYTRPVADCRVGILTLREKWEHYLGKPVSILTEDYLSAKYPLHKEPENVRINAAVLPDEDLLRALFDLHEGEKLLQEGAWIAAGPSDVPHINDLVALKPVEYAGEVCRLKYPWDIFQMNDAALRTDFALLTRGRRSQPIPESNHVVQPGQIFLEEGTEVECSVLNASTGPIYIGKHACIMEGCLIRGPFALGAHSIVKMGTKIYGATSIGPGCVAGGEIKNSVFFAHSNKAHDGYLGDAVIGEWCNLGANTNCSNLKNNVREVQVWSEEEQSCIAAGPKCGLLMGDYSRTGVNTMINTGTLIGVSSHVFGADFPPTYLPSFMWGKPSQWAEYRLAKALGDADAWMHLKGRSLTEEDRQILEYIFHHTAIYRKHLSET